jgi:hypothetical protein
MTNQQLQSKKYIIDYLSDEERNDTIINYAIKKLKQLDNVEYYSCNNPNEIGIALDNIKNGNAIIHFLAHGSQYGIGKITDRYFLEIIHWELLLKSFENIHEKCNSLSINFLAVCNSHYITDFDSKPYNVIWTISEVTNSIESSRLIYSKTDFSNIVSNFESAEMFHETLGA